MILLRMVSRFTMSELISVSYIMWLPISESSNPADTPIIIKVSILTPVYIQNYVPTFFIDYIESET
jgi:hypothetical protein